MASVYYLFKDAFKVQEEFFDLYVNIGHERYLIALAAIKIQRIFRRYVKRRDYLKIRWAALTFQRYIRGWKLRFILGQIYEEHFDRVIIRHYHEKAAFIQSVWRGYVVRKEVSVKEITRRREYLAILNEKTQAKFRNSFESINNPLSLRNQKKYAEEFWNILFHRHHLLRTRMHKGVFSKDDTDEYSVLEKLLNSMAFKKYTKTTRKLYKQCAKELLKEPPYQYTHKKLKLEEEIVRQSKIRKEEVFVCKEKQTPMHHDKNYYKKIPELPYQKEMLCSGKFVPSIKNITRTLDKTKNINSEDFNLYTLKEAVKECEIPSYYLQVWFGKICELHNFLY